MKLTIPRFGNKNELVRPTQTRGRHHDHKTCGEVHNLDFNRTHGDGVIKFSQVSDSLSSFNDFSLHSENSVSKGKVLAIHISICTVDKANSLIDPTRRTILLSPTHSTYANYG